MKQAIPSVRIIGLVIAAALLAGAAMFLVLPGQSRPAHGQVERSRLGQALSIPPADRVNGRRTSRADHRGSTSLCQVMILDAAELGSRRSGVVETVHVREGDSVESGQLLVSLNSDLAQASLKLRERAAADDVDLRYARKVSDVARSEYVRALELNREIPNAHSELKINSLKMEAERALLQIEQAENRIETARLQLAESRMQLATYEIRAPIAGVIERVAKVRGEAVHEGETVIEMANFDRLKIAGDMPLNDAAKIKPGIAVVATVVDPESGKRSTARMARGSIVFVDSRVSDVAQRVHFWAEVDNRQRLLLPGMTATIELLPASESYRKAANRSR